MFQHGGHITKDLYGAVPGVLGGGGAQITFLLDVVFSDYADDPAPVTSPIVGRAGSLTAVENDGSFAITSGQLVFTAQTTAAWGDLSIEDSIARSRAAGLCVLQKSTFGEVNSFAVFGFTDGATSARNALKFAGPSGVVQSLSDTTFTSTGLGIDTHLLTQQQWSVLLRNLGAVVFRDNTLLWVPAGGAVVAVTPMFSNFNKTGSISLFRAASLPANATYPVPALGTRDLDLSTPGTGTGTSSIAAPAAGNTFVHTADTLITLDLTTLQSAGNIIIRFRKQDASNYWDFGIGVGGNLFLRETVGGTPTVRGNTGLGVLTGGEKISIKVNNETITGYYNSTQAWTYASATNFKTKTAGEVNDLGTGGVIANLEARTLDGIANVASSNHPGKGLATSVLPGPRAASDTFTHEADCVLEWMIVSVGTGAILRVIFRVQDSTNYWRVEINYLGDMGLYEVVAGVPTQRGNVSGVLSGGERIIIVAEGTTIKGYYNTTLAWTYASATNFQTQTSGSITNKNDQIITNLIAWPRNLASAPNTPEAANVKAAFDLMGTA